MQYIGKIDRKIYSIVSKDIQTDEVILSDTQQKHIKERHPGNYEHYKLYITKIVEKPDYILEANKPHTALLLKEFKIDSLVFKLILRLQTPKDPIGYKNSIITFMKIDLKEWNRLLRNKKILYRKDDKS